MKQKTVNSGSTDTSHDGLQCAFRFLGYRPRSSAEVRKHLMRRGYSGAVIAEVLNELHALGYIDDERFARGWAQDRFSSRGYGPKRLEQELKTKAVDDGLIRTVLRETFTPGAEVHRARLLLQKRFAGRALSDPKTARQAAGFLQRRGYSAAVISDLLRNSFSDN